MNAKVKVMKVSYNDVKLKKSDSTKLRGFYANKNCENDLLHNHKENGELAYRYPNIQYKIIGTQPVIIAWGDGIKAMYDQIMQYDKINIDGKEYDSTNIDIKLSEPLIGDSAEIREYTFLDPWLCLNQENYKKYVEADDEKKQELLIRILLGNTLSFAKAFGITIQNQLKAEIDLKEIKVNFKNESMTAFYGSFKINFNFPDFFGIGKSVSRGFGTVLRKKQLESTMQTLKYVNGVN